jgi:hypothetical protein
MEELRKQLFNLAILHGLKSCYKVLDSLRDEVRAHGQFLLGEYNEGQEVHVENTIVESSTEPEKAEEAVPVKKVRKPRVKKTNETTTLEQVGGPVSEPVNDAVSEPVNEAVSEPVNESLVDSVPQKLKGNAKKRWQRSQETLKRIELEMKGIFKQDVLTVENVTTWINAGKSYAGIARSYVGCTEEEVSKYCRKHNIKAPVSQ